MNNSSITDLLKLSFVPLISSTRLRNLVNYFSDTENIFKASYTDLLQVELINEKSAKSIKEFDFDKIQIKIDEQWNLIEKFNSKIITFWDKEYPEKLKNIAYPPVFLFVRGNHKLLTEKSIAVVGTRSPTKYGIESTKYFTSNLVKSDLVITSGLAYGIDTIAHQTALDESGKTIAVLGTSVDIIYPKDNFKLAEKVVTEGVLVSEYPMNTAPAIQNFPARNRIIAGLSLGVLLVESDNNGGGIITAKFALDEGNSVFAVPGNINAKKSRGTNNLIKNSEAKLVQNIEDILNELNLKSDPGKVSGKNLEKLTDTERKITELLASEIIHVDKISDECGLNPSETLVTLLNLELEGIIRKLPGNYYQIVE
jgi:DNA processing protein